MASAASADTVILLKVGDLVQLFDGRKYTIMGKRPLANGEDYNEYLFEGGKDDEYIKQSEVVSIFPVGSTSNSFMSRADFIKYTETRQGGGRRKSRQRKTRNHRSKKASHRSKKANRRSKKARRTKRNRSA